MSEGCRDCARLRVKLAKVRDENDRLHQLAARYREKYSALVNKIQTKAAAVAAKH